MEKSEPKKLKVELNSCQYRLQALKIEEQLIDLAGFQRNTDIQIFDVEIENQFGSQTIHTYMSGSQNKDIIVLTHDMSSSSVALLSLIQVLKSKFQVYTFDLPGMGLSSRHPFTIRDVNEVENYFVDSIESWRIKLGLTTPVIFAGHSYGGYIIGLYAIKYEQNVSRLLMLSPMGTKEGTEEENQQKQDEILKNMNFIRRSFYQKVRGYIDDRKSFSHIFQGTFFPSSFMLTKYLDKRFVIPEEDQKVLKSFFTAVFNQKESSENSIYQFYYFPTLIARIPLGKLIQQHKPSIRIDFFFGASGDWVSQQEIKNIYQKKIIKGEIFYVQNASHQLIVESPQEIGDIIFKTM